MKFDKLIKQLLNENRIIPTVHVIPVNTRHLGQYKLSEWEEFSPIKKVPFGDKEIKQGQFFGDNKIVEKYKNDILAGKPISPITIKDGFVRDGYHRASALHDLGFKEYPAVFVTQGDTEEYQHFPDWINDPRDKTISKEDVDYAENNAQPRAYEADRVYIKSLQDEGLSKQDNDFYERYRNAINLYKDGKVILTDNKNLISELKKRGWSEKK
jgi:hypothetical protein